MFKYVVVSGCSLTYGEELIDFDLRYAKVLANGLRSKLKTFALTGVSNEVISQNIINGLISAEYDCKPEDVSVDIRCACRPENTLVVVQWTFPSRLNYFGKNNRFYTIADFNITPRARQKKLALGHDNVFFEDDFDDMYSLKSYYDYHTDPSYLCYNLVKTVHHTQTFLKQKGYKYVFLFASDDTKNIFFLGQESFDHMHEYMFEKSYIPPYYFMLSEIDKDNIFPTSFMNFTNNNKFPIGQMHHPLEKAHAAYGKLLLDHVKNKFMS